MTRLDVITKALRILGVLAIDEEPSGDDEAIVGQVFDAVYAEFRNGLLSFPETNIPSDVFLPMAQLVAAEVASDYGAQPTVSRGNAKLRIMAVVNPDNRANKSDDAVYY